MHGKGGGGKTGYGNKCENVKAKEPHGPQTPRGVGQGRKKQTRGKKENNVAVFKINALAAR
jgi:hypothetical protein